MALQIDIRQMVLLIGSAIDLVGVDDVLHGRRVAIMAVECAKHLGWDQARQNLVFDAALLHDAGVSSTRVHRSIINELDWEGSEAHCERGYLLLRDFTPLSHLAPILRYHHRHWKEFDRIDLNPEIAAVTNLIYLADRVDACALPYHSNDSILLHVGEICDKIRRHSGTFFSPELVDVFLKAARAEAFWLLLGPEFIPQYVNDMASYTNHQPVELADVKRFGLIVSRIVDAKSHFTMEHSLGVARLARYLAEETGMVGEKLDQVEIAALLHDIGKLQIPDEILESPRPLTPQGRALMKKHSFATYQILKRVIGFHDVALWASEHHESLNGSGYPFHLPGDELPLEARIIKVADIFQALSQNRPYRKSLPPEEILQILRDMQRALEVDPVLVDFVASHLEECHKAAGSRVSERELS